MRPNLQKQEQEIDSVSSRFTCSPVRSTLQLHAWSLPVTAVAELRASAAAAVKHHSTTKLLLHLLHVLAPVRLP
jgi:hypothetical protein